MKRILAIGLMCILLLTGCSSITDIDIDSTDNTNKTQKNEQYDSMNENFVPMTLSKTLSHGKIYKIEAVQHFHFPYLLYIPDNCCGDYIILSPANTGYLTESQDDLYQAALTQIEQMQFLLEEFSYPVCIPCFSRVYDKYTHALDAASLSDTMGDFAEIDEQTIRMLNNAKQQLKEIGYSVSDKVITYGFSATGQFAHRFAVTHPDQVKCVVAGGLGSQFTIPLEKYNGYTLEYPIGIADLADYGITFDIETYNKIPQFLFQGSQDTVGSILSNDGVPCTDGYSETAIGTYYGLFQETYNDKSLVSYWNAETTLISSLCPNIEFYLDPDAGHNISEEAQTKILNFLETKLGDNYEN